MKITIIIAFLLIFVTIDAQVVRDEYNKGKRYFKQKDYKKAKQKFTYVVDNNTAYYEAYTYRARIFLKLQLPDSALMDFKKSIKIQEDFLPNYYYRAKYYIGVEEDQRAEKDLNTLLEYRSDFAPAILLRAQIYEKRGDDQLAFKDYNSLIDSKTKNYKVYYQRGLYYSKMRQNTAAIKDFEQAILLKSNFVDAIYALGLSCQILGNYDDAIIQFSKVIKLNQTHKEAYSHRAYLYYKTKDYTAGLEDDKYIVSHFKMREDTLFIRMAKAELQKENLTSADRYLTKAISANPKSINALMLRADVAVKRDRAATGISYLQRIHRIDAKNTDSWLRQADIYMQTKQYKKAVDALTKCIRIKQIGEAYYLRGAAYSFLYDNDNACKDTRKAAALGYAQAKLDLPKVCK